MSPRHIKISEFNYPLPDERIAKYPLVERDSSRLLIYHPDQEIIEKHFHDLPALLPEDDMLVMNNTRVIQARLHFQRTSGAQIEIFLLEPYSPADYQVSFAATKEVSWICMVGNLKKWKGDILQRQIALVDGSVLTLSAERGEPCATGHIVKFIWDKAVSFSEILEAIGELPIPPYLNRNTEESDLKTYQTVYSRIKGSVAAPTAGLHFTENVLSRVRERNIELGEVTLHVGAGTFRPVKCEEIGDHPMHAEWISVQRSLIERLISHGGQCIAVGTTSVRTLESLYYIGCLVHKHPETEDIHISQWMPYENTECSAERKAKEQFAGEELSAVDALNAILDWMEKRKLQVLQTSTQIIIAPGYSYHIVKAIITNFHQPQSTLLLLVSAFVKGDWHRIYEYALSHDFRFLSYGDSSILFS